MIDAIIRGSLGQLGSAILDFYQANSLLVNGIILFYLLMLILGRQTHTMLKNHIKEYFLQRYGEEVQNKSNRWFKKTLEKNDLDWQALSKSSWMPIIVSPKSLMVRFKSIKNLKKIFTSEQIAALFKNQADA
jgi:hypothetical protein